MSMSPTLPTNIVRQGKPSRSVLSDASLRAVHPLLDEPLVLSDPIALPLLGAATEAGSRLCFDYRVPVTMLDPVERVINEVMEQRIAALGEPWLSAFDPTDLQKQLLELGFSTAESATPEDLNARYFARRKDGLRTGGGAHHVREQVMR